MANPTQNLLGAGAIQLPQPPAVTSAWSETADKIKNYFTGVEGALTVFSIVAGVAVGLLWGVQLGLIAGAAGIIVSMAIALCRSQSHPAATPSLPHPPEETEPLIERNPVQRDGVSEYEEMIAEALVRNGINAVGKINIDHLQIDQMNLPFAVPFEEKELIKFLCRCFPNIDLGQLYQPVVDEDFCYGGSLLDLDNIATGAVGTCALIPGVAISFTYQDKRYEIHATEEGVPDGLFERAEGPPANREGLFVWSWQLIALNR